MSLYENATIVIPNVTVDMVSNFNLLIGPILNIYGKPIDATQYFALQMFIELQADPNFNENGVPTYTNLGGSIITPLKSGLVVVELVASDIQTLSVGSQYPISLIGYEAGPPPPQYTLATGFLSVN